MLEPVINVAQFPSSYLDYLPSAGEEEGALWAGHGQFSNLMLCQPVTVPPYGEKE